MKNTLKTMNLTFLTFVISILKRGIYCSQFLLIGVVLLLAFSCKNDDDSGQGDRVITFTDQRDGNIYKAVKIGNQIWMADNLKYLPSVVGPGTGSQSTPYYYVYGYNGTNIISAKETSNYLIYGVLYNWPAAMNGTTSSNNKPSGIQGICPQGWHLPSHSEWLQLSDYLGGSFEAGGKLKESGYTHWSYPNINATNETGFSALPGGFRFSNGTFNSINHVSYWWSTTQDNSNDAWYWAVIHDGSDLEGNLNNKEMGFCIRCVKD